MLDDICSLCELYGIPFVKDDWNEVYINSIDRYPYPWNGRELVIPLSVPVSIIGTNVINQSEAAEILCHEIAHWIKATPKERLSCSFGLPFAEEMSRLSEKERAFFHEKEKEVNAVTKDLLHYLGLNK